ncbi:hypothetical protein R6Q57_027488 [Mikania cordata]
MQKTASSSTLGPEGLDIAQSFFKPIQGASPQSSTSQITKITVVGVGNVGMAIAQTILTQGIADEIALVDINVDKLRGEMLDCNTLRPFFLELRSRHQFLIADHLDLNAQDVQAYIVGEHGDSSVALWSSISVGGVPILSFLERQQIAYEKQTLEKIHKQVVDGAYEVISLKGYTSWAIGYSVASLARTILRDQRSVHPVSVLAKGFHGIDGGEPFLSLPAQLGRNGVLGVTNVNLTDEEAMKLRASARTILEVQAQLGI